MSDIHLPPPGSARKALNEALTSQVTRILQDFERDYGVVFTALDIHLFRLSDTAWRVGADHHLELPE